MKPGDRRRKSTRRSVLGRIGGMSLRPHEPHPFAAAALHAIGARLRELLIAMGAYTPELAAELERLAQVTAAIAYGDAIPPIARR